MPVKLPAIAIILLLAALAAPLAIQAAPAQDSGKLCLVAYDDANGNGVHDEGEGLVPGVMFTVRDSAHVIVSFTTDDRNVPYCFDLLPGNYRISALNAPGRPGGQSWDVPVTAKTEYNVEYGSRQTVAGSSGLSLWGLSGIVLFVGAAAVVGYVAVRGRR